MSSSHATSTDIHVLDRLQSELNYADHLGQALTSRDVIGQARGILKERFGVDEDGAFPMLMRTSTATNATLVDLARWLTSQATDRHIAGQQPPAAT